MIIRKLYKFEGAHIVRNCSSVPCRENIHGHSYVVEVFITSDRLDDGFMVMDFGLLDKVKTFIGSFDHSYSLWQGEDSDFKQFVYRYNRRVAEIPVSPSAEGYALLFFYVIDRILKHTDFQNGEGRVQLHAVRVHETTTGYAEASRNDLRWIDFTFKDIHFTAGITEQWDSVAWWDVMVD
ncbi:6-pyruvoyl trahydropterin synthase family protein [Odoribacter lunatus]|uniref:6-pyruvoyl trahydropterin synthase family protein n=1 Tax=Odoribacter lunatus TaxID=2941335 RepID=UPI00203DE43F|nr:6-pyruvoyl tetrahydropterin synthase family protein [Odoribacter lunatus]